MGNGTDGRRISGPGEDLRRTKPRERGAEAGREGSRKSSSPRNGGSPLDLPLFEEKGPPLPISLGSARGVRQQVGHEETGYHRSAALSSVFCKIWCDPSEGDSYITCAGARGWVGGRAVCCLSAPRRPSGRHRARVSGRMMRTQGRGWAANFGGLSVQGGSGSERYGKEKESGARAPARARAAAIPHIVDAGRRMRAETGLTPVQADSPLSSRVTTTYSGLLPGYHNI